MAIRDHRVPVELATYYAECVALQRVGDAPEIWRRHRAAIAAQPRAAQEAAWNELCAHVWARGVWPGDTPARDAKVWLKHAIAVADARDRDTND